MSAVTEKKIISVLKELTEIQQTKLLDFIEVMSRQKPISPLNLLSFAGSIPQNDLEKIKKSIEQDCNKIDIHEW
jgi:hypothetical protein